MGLVDKLHRKVFDAVQKERVRLLSDDNTLFAWMAKNGVDAKRFAAIYHSYTIDQAKIPQSMQLTASYNFDGVPAVIVDGRYRALNAPGDDHVATLAVVDQLIAMARKDRAARK
jgi:thiol:disulfide interchange protein DsbA